MASNKRILFVFVGIAAAVAVVGGIAVYKYIPSSASNAPKEHTNNGDIPSRFPKDVVRNGISYGEWTARWWKWAVEAPEGRNPVKDKTGEHCSENQSGPVWFLAGSFGGLVERHCVIPAGKDILFPLMNAECSEVEYPDLHTEAELRNCAVSQNEGVTELMVSVDGVELKKSELRDYRVQSPLFQITLPEGNVWGVPAGTTRTVSDGYWVFLKALPPGNHVVHFRGVIPDFTTVGTNNFVTEANYQITVKG